MVGQVIDYSSTPILFDNKIYTRLIAPTDQ